ncbi:type II CAAX prenyl endopeptidase Rce1 family protein [Clostridium cochlearium]|uniref:CPBP family glutamic-type intramembrane protease n=1 Tax=Clostridium cochlearium TaxID=1494 RepID=UPI000B948B68|nr:CPBP family glutamic-type intramembrane protease [Clostridium cochlearium]MBV1821069.1 CPBP family intramembrane metalloprotease [Bacteroidales bacterium MSK.15.36]MCG4571184.1 CPBP family glutamic-type intramembrane protease [Clostridium cochlearium]NME95726.1 CPBP family intramembrane metalloprotease [Clostridium cochlearium]SNV72388.1 abortive infection protein [Clostridium cochlearium]STA92093.1 abortive infection protein [Clostridium cochlearium]
MKKSSNQFLLISFIISYICFGIIIQSKIVFNDIFNNPLYLSIFIIGCLGPLISAFIIHVLNKEKLDGINGFANKLTIIKNPKAIILIPIFLITHYGFAILLKGVYKYGKVIDFFRYLPLILIILGSQEIGWRGIVQPANEEKNGFWKSSIATGLFWSLWFLPLIYIPKFVILPQFYAQFAAYLVGISILLTTLYKLSGSIIYCIVLSSFIFALFPVIILKQSFILVGIALVDAIVATIFKDKVFS